MKKVLMVAAYFPPAGGIGTVRVAKNVKYLREFGWEPTVLTVDADCHKRDGWTMDETLLGDLPEGVVVRRSGLPPQGVFRDVGIRWLPILTRDLVRSIRAASPDVVYLTGDPFFCLVAAPLARMRINFRYVVDLRDPWSLAVREPRSLSPKLRVVSCLSNLAERFVLGGADRLICVSAPMAEQYRLKYRQRPNGYFKVITNGFDPPDYSRIQPRRMDGFTIVYTGKFRACSQFRDPTRFFKALKVIAEQGMKLTFIHVGKQEPEVVQYAQDAGLRPEQVRFAGLMSYEEAIATAKGANLLLLIGTGDPTEQTTKIFDYIACGRPILGLVRVGTEVERILRSVPNSFIVSGDVTEIVMAIRGAVERNAESVDFSHAAALSQFERRNLVHELALLLDEVVRCGNAPAHESGIR